MAFETKTSRVAGFKIDLVSSQNPNSTTSRTVSFDVASTVTGAQVQTVASAFFAQAGMSNVFQPNGWRDYEGDDEVYIMTGVTPILTEKTTMTGEVIVPA